MLNEYSYAAGLAIMALLALVSGRGGVIASPLYRTVGVIVATWAVGIGFNILTEVRDGWMFNIVIDTLAAWAILYHPAGRWQALGGTTYCVQIAMHGGYGVASMQGIADPYYYYDALTTVAWLQLLLIGGWCGGILGGRFLRWRFGDRGAAFAAPRRIRLAKSR